MADFEEWDANNFQPDCCASLVQAWLSALRHGEPAMIEWCRKASLEADGSRFYGHHKARNPLVNGTHRAAFVRATTKVLPLMFRYANATDDDELIEPLSQAMTQNDRNLRVLDRALDRGTGRRAAYLAIGLRQLGSFPGSDDVLEYLKETLPDIPRSPAFIGLSIRYAAGSHIVGLMKQGATVYFYDPNMHAAYRFRSVSDLLSTLEDWASEVLEVLQMNVYVPT